MHFSLSAPRSNPAFLSISVTHLSLIPWGMGHVGARGRPPCERSAVCSGICCGAVAGSGSGKAEKVGAATDYIVFSVLVSP